MLSLLWVITVPQWQLCHLYWTTPQRHVLMCAMSKGHFSKEPPLQPCLRSNWPITISNAHEVDVVQSWEPTGTLGCWVLAKNWWLCSLARRGHCSLFFGAHLLWMAGKDQINALTLPSNNLSLPLKPIKNHSTTGSSPHGCSTVVF